MNHYTVTYYMYSIMYTQVLQLMYKCIVQYIHEPLYCYILYVQYNVYTSTTMYKCIVQYIHEPLYCYILYVQYNVYTSTTINV